MINISAIIIAKNAEKVIADCIDSVSFCDEIIVIDDGSKDRTVELAKYLKTTVYNYNFHNFSEGRNFGLRKAKGKWVLYIDTDERVSPELKKDILEKIGKEKNGFSAYELQRKNFYFGNHEWLYIEKFVRLFKKSALTGWKGELHETPVVKGRIGDLEGYLNHYTHNNLTSMVEKTIVWSGIEAELRFQANHPKMTWWRFFRVMITAFYDSYFRQQGRKTGTAGLVESMYQAFSMFITYARLWEKQNRVES